MKIITVFNNYLGNKSLRDADGVDTDFPVWVFLPDSSLMKSGNPFFVPDLESLFQNAVSTECMAFPSLAFRISRLGKNIEPRFSDRYISDMALCVNFIAHDICRARAGAGLPWTEGIAFDRSFLIGETVAVDLQRLGNIEVKADIKKPDGTTQSSVWHLNDLKYSVNDVLSRISRMNTLKIGDILVPAIPDSGFKIEIGDEIEVSSQGLPSVNVYVK